MVDLIKATKPEWRVVADTATVADTEAAVKAHRAHAAVLDLHLRGMRDTRWIQALAAQMPVLCVTGETDTGAWQGGLLTLLQVLKPLTRVKMTEALDWLEKAIAARQAASP
ncbi:hypothetical protein LZ017_13515 [Pelomonas sp. CA6]|nr:hypothetical protein [Pelomonas sp. CA6]